MNKSYLKLFGILLVLFESIIAQTDYVFKRFSLDQIDTVFLSSISSSTDYIAELRDSTAPNRIKNAQNLLYYKDYVFIGAENWLLKINSKTFKIEQSIRYGPLYDSPFCRYSPIDECLYGHKKTLTNNQNKLLLIYKEKNLLLSCWSARQGICDLRDLDDLNNVVLNSSIAAVANDPLNSTIGFIASSPNSQDVLYIAATYNNNGPYRTDIPALSGRSLQSNQKFMQIISSNSQGLKSSKASIEFMSRFMKTFVVKYIDAFNLGIYNYFLTVQHSDTDSLLRGDLLMSKIARLCLNDLSFTKSYTEMPIKCVGSNSAKTLRSIDYNELISSKYIEINSKHYLIGLFQHTRRNSFNSSMDLGYSKQAVCIFKMDDVQEKFRDNINKCYNTDVMRGLNFIKPDQKCLAKKFRFNANEYIDDDFCSSAENGLYPIGGTIPIKSSAVLQFENKFYDSVTLFESEIINTMILKSEKKNSVNFYDMNKMRLYRTVQISSDNVDYLPKVKDISLDETGSVYVLNKNELVKLRMFNCEKYLSCGECIGQSVGDEPYCGWCSSINQCSSRSECSSDKWLNANNMNITSSNGIESVCVDIERVEPKLMHITSQEWIRVEFRKELSLMSNDNYSCVFVNKYELETRAVKIDKNQLKCPIPHSSLIEKLYEPFKLQKLVLADDGIFKVAQSNYESNYLDRIDLGFYIKNSDFKYGWTNSAPLYNITVINCGMHKSCVSCVSDECSWCNGKCRQKDSQCTNELDACSSFDPATNKLLIPYTAHRQQAPLTFSLKNIEHVTNMECLITYRDGMALDQAITVPFKVINKTHSSCILSDIFSQLESYFINGQVQTNLRLFNGDYFIDSPSNGKLALMFYKCEHKANDCSSCLSINRQLSCMWCSGSCRFMNPHSKLAVLSQCIGPSNAFLVNNSNLNQCDKPQIQSISPLKVPYSGGSILTINGVNLGSSFDDLLSVNLKCGQSSNECDLIASKYTTSKQIVCKLRPFATSSNECSVSVKLRTSIVISGSSSVELSNGLISLLVKASQIVRLVDPIITSVTPSQVIQSANFVWLTINGVDLDSGRNRQLQIIDNVNDFKQRVVKCDIKNVTSESIKCRLNEKFSSLGKKNLRLIIDEYTTINSNLKVNSDPLVKSIDNWISFYAGGVNFELSGFNFDSVQSAYTFVNYRDIWYSEPVSAINRISNDRIVFQTPALSDAFFALTKPEDGSRYLLQVGFLMDGFNVTLKDQYISYVPNLEPNSLEPVSLDLIKLNDLYTIKMSVRIDASVAQYNELIKRNIQLYVGCSMCHQIQWSTNHQTDFTCTLPALFKSRKQTTDQSCESRVFNTLLSNLNSHGLLQMVNLFVGNSRFEIDQALIDKNQNLELYIQSYQMNNVDNFIHTVKQLEQQQSVRTDTIKDILDKYDNFMKESKSALVTPGLMSNRNLFILSAIIASIVLILILLTLSLSSYVIKLKNSKNMPMYKLGCKRGRIEFDLIQKQIDQLELSIRPKCSQLYQQLHNDYLNELNNDLIYTLNGLPVWNYKTYLHSYIFPCKHKLDLIYSPLNLVMSSSSMSNSTTNTLLSTHTPIQNVKQNMSVYATIKSSSMLRFDEDNSFNRQQFVSYGNIGEAMLLFDQLIHNKSFLITFIGVCESQRDTFGSKERHNFSSLITLALKDNLHYLYSIIKSLLSEHIRDCLSSKRSIFGANDNLVEPMLNNFISMFMYDYQRDSQTALHLYRLVKSIKSYINMAPCDQIKQLSLNSLNEDTLLSDSSLIGPYQTIYVNVMLNANILSAANSKNLFVVALVDTDTIQQAKEKIVDSVFKRTNMGLFNLASVPSTSDLDLELCLILIQGNETNQTTLITLKETEDELVNSDSLATTGPLKRLLTLKEYNIQNGSFINLNIKSTSLLVQNKDNHVYMSTMSMNNEYVLYASKPVTAVNETQRYHLIKPNENYTNSNTSSLEVKKKKKKKYEKLLTVKSQDSSVTTDSLIKHDNPINHLSRLLMNKGTIQPFIDQFIESIFSNSSSLPPVITNLFEFIDSEIKKSNLKSDEANKIAKMCKVNVYFVRYWVNMIKNPDLIIDCDKSLLIDSSLSCIAQAFLDSCSSSDVHNLYDTNSPINRLLFIREVPKYKEMIDAFFADLKSMPTTSEHEMHFYLNEFSKCKNFELQNQVMGATVNSQMSQSAQPELNSVQVLLQLYEYYEKYQHQINTALGQQQCSVLLPVHHRLVQIKDLMSMSTMATNQTLNRNAALFANNPYQQINANYQGVNCYAATSDLIVSYPNMNTSVQLVNTLPHLRNQFQPIQHQHQQQFF